MEPTAALAAHVAHASDVVTTTLRRTRWRWRARVALHGLALVVVLALVALVVAAWAMLRLRYADESIVGARLAVWLVVAVSAARWIVGPLARRLSDARVALYVERHEPSLDAALVSALEARASGAALNGGGLARQVVVQAAERARAVEYGGRIERAGLRRGGALAFGAVAAAAGIITLAPPFVRTGARLVLWPTREAVSAVPVMAVAVRPGNVTIARGADVAVSALSQGFTTDAADLLVRRGRAAQWERVPMSLGGRDGFQARILDVDSAAEYLVESEGVRSPAFTIAVVDRPTVRRLALELRYPAYTGRAVERVADGGDVAAPRGTIVRVRATPTMAVQGGRLVIEGGDTVALARDASGALVGAMRVVRSGFYHVDLLAGDGAVERGSLDYVIDALPDRPPTVAIAQPGRDVQATRLEEVFASVEAEDDYGVSRVELRYQVNGGAEQTVVLHDGAARRTPQVTAGHTFFLEEMPLKPGDVVSYHARALDNDAVDGAQTAATDVYFLRIRPFDRAYRQAESGGGGGGGGADNPTNLAERQREIVAATFKLARDSALATGATAQRQRREDLATLALAQGRLRTQVEELVQRVRQRGNASDSATRQIAEALPLAAAAMKDAEEQLGRRAPADALSPEQRALQQLQRAEAAFRDVQVQMGGGGGGGGGGGQTPEDLADLFGLQTERLRNQYESVQRSERQREQQSAEVDRTLERLRELASRQQRESERLRREAEALRQRMPQQSGGGAAGSGGSQSGSASGGASGGGAAQRQLAQEAEELARQLERLMRESPSPEVRESARQLQDAASAMRRAAAAQGDGAAGSAAAARDRLEAASRALDAGRNAQQGERLRSLQRRADALAETQRALGADAERLSRGEERDAGSMSELMRQKDSLAAGVSALERDLDRAARETVGSQPGAARRLREGAAAIRDSRVGDKVRASKIVAQRGSPEYVRNLEAQIGENLDVVRDRVGEAVAASRAPVGRRTQESLDRARQLAQSMSSLGDRLRQRRDDAAAGARGGQPDSQAAGGQQGGQQGGQAARGGRAVSPNGVLGGGGDATPGRSGGDGTRLAPDDARQLGRELRERRGEAEALRRELAAQGVDARELDALIARMRALEALPPGDLSDDLLRLQSDVAEGLGAFEFGLRRTLAGAPGDVPRLGRGDDVPAGYRAMVDEYFRALARGRRP